MSTNERNNPNWIGCTYPVASAMNCIHYQPCIHKRVDHKRRTACYLGNNAGGTLSSGNPTIGPGRWYSQVINCRGETAMRFIYQLHSMWHSRLNARAKIICASASVLSVPAGEIKRIWDGWNLWHAAQYTFPTGTSLYKKRLGPAWLRLCFSYAGACKDQLIEVGVQDATKCLRWEHALQVPKKSQ